MNFPPHIEQAIRARFAGKCANCGSPDRLRIRAVVPAEAGGRMIETNGTVLCRTCELAVDSPAQVAQSEQKLVNFWTSRKLHDALLGQVEASGFSSMGAFLRFLITKFVADAPRYDDIEQYQDEGSDVKVNFWVDRHLYGTFKAILEKRGVTVTDTLKGLVIMYSINSKERN